MTLIENVGWGSALSIIHPLIKLEVEHESQERIQNRGYKWGHTMSWLPWTVRANVHHDKSDNYLMRLEQLQPKANLLQSPSENQSINTHVKGMIWGNESRPKFQLTMEFKFVMAKLDETILM